MVKEGLVWGWFGVGFAWFGLGCVIKTCFVTSAVLDSTVKLQLTSKEGFALRLVSLGLASFELNLAKDVTSRSVAIKALLGPAYDSQ